MHRAPSTALIVFAKAPVAGLAKTRLIPALGAERAAALAWRLLEHTVSAGVGAGFADLELCTTPDTGHRAFRRLAVLYRIALTPQGDGDLGERMHRALSRQLARHERVLLIGTDAPALDAAMLREAAQALTSRDAVFVPVQDGGYALVGLRRTAADLFTDIPWSTSDVMAATRQRARAAEFSWTELPTVADIDTPADLAYLPDDWRP